MASAGSALESLLALSCVPLQALSWFTKGRPIDDSTFRQGPHVAE
jgi:hypothetical protein